LTSSITGTSITYATGGRAGQLSSLKAGATNTGEGGSGIISSSSNGYAGGSGIVIIRYPI